MPDFGVLVVSGTLAPLSGAPNLLAPANGSYEDTSATPTFTWQYNPGGLGATQTGYQFVRIVNGGATQFWNAGTQTWQSGSVWNPSTGQSVTFPAGTWPDGNVYQWTVATEDASGYGPPAAYFTVNAQAPPSVTVLAPSGTITTASPVVQWSASLPAGASQTAYEVIIYDAAQYTAPGFTPGYDAGVYDGGVYDAGTPGGPSIYDTGVVGSSTAVSFALDSVPVYLADNTSYRAYVQVTETGGQVSPWTYAGFTTSYAAPATPSITAATGTDPSTGCPLVTLTVGAHDNYLSLDDANPSLGLGSWSAVLPVEIASSPSGLEMFSTSAGNLVATTGKVVPIVASTEYSAVASFLAGTTGRSCYVAVLWYTSAFALISTTAGTAVLDNTSTPTQASVTATSPSNAAYALLQVVAEAAAVDEIHYVSEIGLFDGANTTWTPGGFGGLGTVVILRSDGIYVRNASLTNPTPLPTAGAVVVVDDYEAVPTVQYAYSAFVLVSFAPNQVVVSPVATSGDVTLTTTAWWELDPTNPASAVSAQMINWQAQVTEQSTANLVMGQSVPTVIASVMGGTDGTATVETFDPVTYTGFQTLLQSQKTIFISSPWGAHDTVYARIGPQTGGMSSGVGNVVKDSTLLPSTQVAMHRTTAITWVAQFRPAV